MTLRIVVAGATGKVGAALCRAIGQAPDLSLVGAVARRAAGKRLGDEIGSPSLAVTIDGRVEDALDRGCDVFVDYTRADSVKAHVMAALERNAAVVIGTSGLTDADFAEIGATATTRERGVFAAGNFAITAVLLQRFALLAAAEIPSWEVIEYAYDRKIDAPSGTARELATKLATVHTPSLAVPVSETVGARDARGATLGGAQVHSVRLPGFTSSVEVIFGLAGERLTIRHDSLDPSAPYVGGTLLAVRRVSGLTGVVRGLDRLI
jgi:4-hydroxy-tetrahydrodipicolinate reductase